MKMNRPRLTYEEFKALFQEEFPLEEALKSEYDAYLAVFEPLDQFAVPLLSPNEKVKLFENTWETLPTTSSRLSFWYVFIKKPAVTFALGIFLGCVLSFFITHVHVDMVQSVQAEPALTIEQEGHTQIYKGKVIDQIYSQLENPKMVLEKKESSSPQPVVYGTLDHGEIYVVLNK